MLDYGEYHVNMIYIYIDILRWAYQLMTAGTLPVIPKWPTPGDADRVHERKSLDPECSGEGAARRA